MAPDNRTIYDQRTAVERHLHEAAPKLYWALKNLLEAVEERPDRMGIESITIAEAHAALQAASL